MSVMRMSSSGGKSAGAANSVVSASGMRKYSAWPPGVAGQPKLTAWVQREGYDLLQKKQSPGISLVGLKTHHTRSRTAQ